MITMMLSSLIFASSMLQLPSFFSDHMVLQRGKPINVFGYDAPNSLVTVALGNKTAKGMSDEKGYFKVVLPPQKAGGPYELSVAGTGIKTIRDVLVGEVWICSGQSNMEWTVNNTKDFELSKTETDPNIRMFTVVKNASDKLETDVLGSWVPSSPNTVGNFSGVGFAFAQRLFRELKVPIGMIHTSWGGTPAEAWTSDEMLGSNPITKPIFDRAAAGRKTMEDGMPAYQKGMKEWQTKVLPDFLNGGKKEWASPDLDDSDWKVVDMPYQFPADFDGTVWVRFNIDLTNDAKEDSLLDLGAIDDVDQAYVNGVLVGTTDFTVPNFYLFPRKYTVPKSLLHKGKNIVAIRIYDAGGGGGFSALANVSGSLIKSVKVKVESTQVGPDPRVANPPPAAPMGQRDPNFPSSLYKGMLYPLAPYTIQGAIWYQGESNAGRAVQYRTLLANMITDWRNLFKQGEFSFYIVQLANFQKPSETQFDSGWAELCDAQDFVGQTLKNCGTATINDIGEADDIHPRNKRDVGERLARIALFKNYKKKIEWQGPRLEKATFTGGMATLKMSHANGLRTKDGMSPHSFAIAGADNKWVWANAVIQGKTIVLSHPSVPNPVSVRYAWQDNPQVNLINSDGLPAMPFRTDTLPLWTEKNR
jgi:sialate O-acetylesterase